MTKIGNKGFTLVEVVVVSVVIITSLVSLFTIVNRMDSAFDKRNRYYDIDALYIANNINYMLLKTGEIDGLISSNFKTEIDEGIYLLNDDYPEVSDICDSYLSKTSDSHVYGYSVLYNKSEFDIFKRDVIKENETFFEYLDYLDDKLNFDDDYTYMIIVEIQKSRDDCYYYTLKVR